MTQGMTPGARLRDALDRERPLQVVGAINAYAAIMAERAGFQAIYLSGSGVATASFGIPDLGMTSLQDVLEDVRRITGATSLPLLVDADTGWGGVFGVERTVREMIRAGAAGIHLEDQVANKRCGHRPGKNLVETPEMVARLEAACQGRTDDGFVIMARTDACAVEGLNAAVARARAYLDAGADMIFAEALTDLEQYRAFTAAVEAPVLANITEFGRTPLYGRDDLAEAGVRLVLYPLSAFRAMNAAALAVFEAIRKEGTQESVLNAMQTREELYDILNYYAYEQRLDARPKGDLDDG